MNEQDVIRNLVSRAWIVLLCLIGGSVAAWYVLSAVVSPSYLASGIVELGYFNPRDYLPHPVVSTRGAAALVNDPTFFDRILYTVRSEGFVEMPRVGASPIEDGLIRIEGRADEPQVALRASVLACSLLVNLTNGGYERELTLIQNQLDRIRTHAALAESLVLGKGDMTEKISASSAGEVLRALAHFTEIQIKTETDAEHLIQKKQSRILVLPAIAQADRPPLVLLSLIPGLVLALFAGAFISSRLRTETDTSP